MRVPPAVSAASSAMIAMLSRSSAAHRARSRVKAAAKRLPRVRKWRMHRPQPPRPAPACAACTMSSGLCGPSWPYPVRPAPALRAQAGFLASFRVRHHCRSPSHRSPVLVLRPRRGPKVRHVARATHQSLKLAFVLKRGSRPPRPFCRSKIITVQDLIGGKAANQAGRNYAADLAGAGAVVEPAAAGVAADRSAAAGVAADRSAAAGVAADRSAAAVAVSA